jgi:hypothetical protein
MELAISSFFSNLELAISSNARCVQMPKHTYYANMPKRWTITITRTGSVCCLGNVEVVTSVKLKDLARHLAPLRLRPCIREASSPPLLHAYNKTSESDGLKEVTSCTVTDVIAVIFQFSGGGDDRYVRTSSEVSVPPQSLLAWFPRPDGCVLSDGW